MGNIKWFIPRKYIVVSKPLCNREFKKLRQWLDNNDDLEIVTWDSKQKVMVINKSKVDRYKNRKTLSV